MTKNLFSSFYEGPLCDLPVEVMADGSPPSWFHKSGKLGLRERLAKKLQFQEWWKKDEVHVLKSSKSWAESTSLQDCPLYNGCRRGISNP